MKRIFCVLTVVALAAASCQKELTFENAGAGTGGTGSSGTTDYYIRCRFNGMLQEYKTDVTATKGIYPGSGNLRFLSLQGRTGTAARPAFGITVNDTAVIVVNRTYDDTPVNGTFSSMSFMNATTDNFSSALITIPLSSAFYCKFTVIGSTQVKGTFSGTMVSLTHPDTIHVTDGEFFAKQL